MFKVKLDALRSEMQGDLNKCNIHVLREQGSKLGVPSVTTYKKNELINLIIEKKLSNHKSYEVDKIPEYNSEVSIIDKENLMEAYRKNETIEGDFVSGLLELGENVDGFIRVSGYQRSKDDVFVPQGIINEYKLKYGDSIVGKATNLQSQNFKGIYYIVSINGQKAGGFIRKDFAKQNAVPGLDKISIGTSSNKMLQLFDAFSPLAKGHRSIIFSESSYGITQLMCDLSRELIVKGIKTMALFLGEKPEMLTYLRRELGENVIATGSETSQLENEKIAQLVLEKMKREAEIGKHVAIVLGDIGVLYGESNRNILGRPFNYRTFFGSGRMLENGGSLTIVTFSRRIGPIGESVYETLLPLANSVNILRSGDFYSDKPTYDFYGSFSDYYIGGEKDQKLVEELKYYILNNDSVTQEELLEYYKTIKM